MQHQLQHLRDKSNQPPWASRANMFFPRESKICKHVASHQRQQNSHANNTNGEDTIIAIGGLEIAEETATLETTDNIYWLNLEQQTWPEYRKL